MNYSNFKVVVRCFTFNHSKYIVDAMNGFTMQQTDFPYVCCIVDDASTDGEQEIIHKYMETNFAISDETVAYQKETEYAYITYAPHKTNINCYFVVLYLKENHYSNPKYKGKKKEYLKEWIDEAPYEAICEGDDYWIDPLKLQKQVDALENDENVMMVYGDYRTIDEFGKEIYRDDYTFLKQFSKSGDILPELFMTNFPLTCTVCVRRSVLISQYYMECPTKLDFTLFMAASFLGNAFYLEEKIAAYRKQANSLTNSKLNLVNKAIDVSRTYACLKYISGWAKKRSAWINMRIKYHIMIYAVQQYRNKNEKTLISHLLRVDRNYLYLMIALIGLSYRKLISTMGLGSKYKTY